MASKKKNKPQLQTVKQYEDSKRMTVADYEEQKKTNPKYIPFNQRKLSDFRMPESYTQKTNIDSLMSGMIKKNPETAQRIAAETPEARRDRIYASLTAGKQEQAQGSVPGKEQLTGFEGMKAALGDKYQPGQRNTTVSGIMDLYKQWQKNRQAGLYDNGTDFSSMTNAKRAELADAKQKEATERKAWLEENKPQTTEEFEALQQKAEKSNIHPGTYLDTNGVQVWHNWQNMPETVHSRKEAEFYDTDREDYDRDLYNAVYGEGAYEKRTDELDTQADVDKLEQELDKMWTALESGRMYEYDADPEREKEHEQAIMLTQGHDMGLQTEADKLQKKVQKDKELEQMAAVAPEAQPFDASMNPEYSGVRNDMYLPTQIRAKGDAADDAFLQINNGWEEQQRMLGNVDKDGNLLYNGPGRDELKDEWFVSDEPMEEYGGRSEKDIFNGYYQAGRKDEAMAWLEGIRPFLRERKATFRENFDRETARLEIGGVPVGAIAGAATVPLKQIAAIPSTIATVGALFGMEGADDPNSDWYALTKQTQNIREERGNVWDESLVNLLGEGAEGAGRFLNGMVYSMMDNVHAMSTAGLLVGDVTTEKAKKLFSGVVQGIMSTEATADEMVSRLEEGKDPDEAAAYAIANGIIEAITENIGMDALFSVNSADMIGNWKGLSKAMAKSFAAEGGEEMLSEGLDMLFDNIVSTLKGHENDFTRRYNELRQTMSDEEAYSTAMKEVYLKFGQSFLAGGLSGMFFAGGQYMKNKGAQGRAGENVRSVDSALQYNGEEHLIEIGQKMGEGTESYRLASELAEMKKQGKNISKTRLGQLAQNIGTEAQIRSGEETKNAIEKRAADDLMANGMSGEEAGDMAQIISKAATEGIGKLSRSEKNAITGDERAWKTFESLVKKDGKLRQQIEQDLEGSAKEYRSYAETAVNLMEGKTAEGFDAKSVGEQLATEKDIQDATGEKVDGPRGVIVKGQHARLEGMEETQDGWKYKVTIDGKTEYVDASAIKATSFTTAAVLRMQATNPQLYSGRYTNTLIQQIDSGNVQNVGQYMKDAHRIHWAAYLNEDMPQTGIEENAAKEIYLTSQEDAIDELKKQAENMPANAKGAGQGSVYMDGHEYGSDEFKQKMAKLSAEDRARVEHAAEIAKMSGVRLDIVESGDSFVHGTESRTGITINLDSYDSKAAQKAGRKHHILVTLGHEMTHWLQRNNRAGYNEVKAFVLDRMRDEGVDLAERCERIMDSRRAAGEDISMTGAIDELVAQACDQVLGNEEAVNYLKEHNNGLYQKIKQFVKGIIDRFKSVSAGMEESASRDARVIMYKYGNELAKLWFGKYDEVLTGRIREIEGEQTETKQEEGNTRYSFRTSDGEELSITDEQLHKNKMLINEMDPSFIVVESDYEDLLNGDFVEKAYVALTKNGETATNPVIGSVILAKSGLRHIAARKGLAYVKSMVVPAVKHVIENGRIVHIDNSGHNGHDSVIIADKIKTPTGTYYVGVLVSQDMPGTKGQKNRYSFHAALIINENTAAMDSTEMDSEELPKERGSVPIFKILHEIANINRQSGNNERLSRADEDTRQEIASRANAHIRMNAQARQLIYDKYGIKENDIMFGIVFTDDGKVDYAAHDSAEKKLIRQISKADLQQLRELSLDDEKWRKARDTDEALDTEDYYENAEELDAEKGKHPLMRKVKPSERWAARILRFGNQVALDREAYADLDKRYADAVARGDFATAERMLMDKYQQMEKDGLIGYKATGFYSGDHKTIAQAIKTGDAAVIHEAAEQMALKVPDNAVLIPMPPHEGKVTDTTDTLILAKEISKITGRPVAIALESDPHMSRREAKQAGKTVTAESMGFRKTDTVKLVFRNGDVIEADEIPEMWMPVFIDNAVAGGVTAKAAHDAMGRGITLAYAQTSRSKTKGAKYLSVTYDANDKLIPYSQRMDPDNPSWKYSKAEIDEDGEAVSLPKLEISRTLYFTGTDEEIEAGEKVMQQRVDAMKKIIEAGDFTALMLKNKPYGRYEILHPSTRPGVRFQLTYYGPDGEPTMHENYGRTDAANPVNEAIHSMDELYRHYVTESFDHELDMSVLRDGGNTRQSMAEEGMDVNAWMMSQTPSSVMTESERELISAYRGLRTKIDLTRKRIMDYTKRLQALEAKTDTTIEERDEMRELRSKLQVNQDKLTRLEEELYDVTSGEGYARVMQQQSHILKDFVNGKTQAQVQASIDTMSNEAERAEKEIEQRKKTLQRMAEGAAVKTVKRELGRLGLRSAVDALRTQYATNMSRDEMESRFAEIVIKMANGEDVTEDVQALANDIATNVKGWGSEEADEILGRMRGMTIVIGPGQQAEMKANHITLKDLRARTKGSGIRFVFGERSTLDANAEELMQTVPELRGKLENEKASLFNVVDFVEGLLAQKKGNAADYGINPDEVMLTVKTIAEMMLNEQAGGMSGQALLEKIKKEAGIVGKALEAVEEARQSVERIKWESVKARGPVSVLARDAAASIKYFNEMSKQAAEVERQRVRKGLIEVLSNEHTRDLIRQQEEYEERIKKDKKARELHADNEQLRHQITTVTSRIRKRLTEETDQKNIPEEAKPLARMISSMLVNHDMSGSRRVLNAPMKALQAFAEKLMRMDVAGEKFDPERDLSWLVIKAPNEQDNDYTLRDKVWQDLVDIETGLLEYGQAEGRGNVTLADRKAALEKVRDAMSEIWDVINARRQAFIAGQKYQVFELAEQMDEDMEQSRFKGERKGFGSKARNTFWKAVGYGNLTPEYFFKNLKNRAMSLLHRGLQDAEQRSGLEAQKARERIARIAAETGYATWDGQEKHTIKLASGRTITITTEQLMALYATWKRESNALRPQETSHLLHGGFILPETDTEKGKPRREKTSQVPIRMTEAELESLGDMLTEQQREFVDQIVEYMSTDLAELGNEASMRTYGIKKFTEQYYFPIRSWGGVLNSSSDRGMTSSRSDNRAMRQSFTKRVTNNASNAIEIADFTPTAMKHIVGMITFNTVGPAVENMNKVLNQQLQYGEIKTDEATGEENDYTYKRNMRARFQEAYGVAALEYLEQFMKDVNGGVSRRKETSLREKLLSIFKKNAVAGSLSVAAQQPLSYIRAAMMISPKYLAAAINPKYWKGSYREMMEHSGIAVIKEMGKFDMNYGRSMEDFITPEGMTRRGKRAMQKASDIATGLPQKMDAMTWTRMWTACKLETQAKNPGLQGEELLKKTAERFNDVMRRTQVYDSVMVKSANMRSDSYLKKVATSFMAEPTLSLNVLADAWQNIREEGGMKNAAKALVTFVLSAAAQAGAKAFFGAGRTPDKKKTKEENFLNKFGYNLLNEMNVLGLIPGYNSLMSVLIDGELKDDAMGVIGKAVEVYDKIAQLATGEIGKKGLSYRDLEDSVGQLFQLATNIPLKNAMRDFRAMVNFFSNGTATWTGDTYANRPTSNAVLKYQAYETLMSQDMIGLINKRLGDAGYKTDSASYYERIYDAIKRGDMKAAEEMKEYMLQTKITAQDPEKSLDEGIRKKIKADEDLSAEESLKLQKEYGLKKTTDYVLEQYREGKITRKQAEEMYRKEKPDVKDKDLLETLDGIDYKKAGGTDEKYSNYTPVYEAIEANKADEIRKAVKYMMDNGYKPEDIKKTINGKYKNIYLNADSNGKIKIRNAIQLVYKAIGLTATDADKIIDGWKKKDGSNAIPAADGYRAAVNTKNMTVSDSGGRGKFGIEGRYGKGNIDLNNRKVVHNEDGTISTERSFSTNIDGKEILLPTVIDGKIVSEREAIQHYFDTGEYLGIFDTPEEADEYAENLHKRQEWYYGK